MAKTPANSLLDDIFAATQIGENDDWEFKAAKGGFPGSFWETYSAMANSAGGMIVLGVLERANSITLDGISLEQLEAYKKTFWDQQNNRQKISRAIVASSDVMATEINGSWLLAIRIRVATRRERPIYIGQNPFDGTYKRRHEGDYICSPEEVRRMFADADNIPADARILDGYGLDDIDQASFASFRSVFRAAKPGHPWLDLSDGELFEKLGCWRQDRNKEDSGFTLAGMLMFGKHQAIISPDVAPAYIVDFRDYRGRRPEERWGDRLFPDGTWEANLFQFYRRSWPKIVADLRVPFALRGIERTDETSAHEALREAVVNSIIHADYAVGGGIVINRYNERYMIENPGTLLVSQEQLRRGGVSECRNKSLQRMFMLMGAGEQAGSGFARIQGGWKEQQWRAPRLVEQSGPDRVRLDMPMICLIPQWALDTLRKNIGTSFEGLAPEARVALATAMIEGEVTNTRMQDLIDDHPTDITKLLRSLVGKGFLETDNQRRWTRYRLPATIGPHLDLFSGANVDIQTSLQSSSSSFEGNSLSLPAKDEELPMKSKEIAPKDEEWKSIAAEIASKGKASTVDMEAAIIEVCRGRYLTLSDLAKLLN